MSFPTLLAAIEGYMIAKAAKRLSPNSLRSYRGDLERFAERLNNPTLEKVTSKQIEQFFKFLSEDFRIEYCGSYKIKKPKKLSAKSIQNAWSVINNFWKWAAIEFDIDNPFNVPYIKANTKPVNPVSQSEIKSLLKACDYAMRKNGSTRYKTKRQTAKRDRAMILLMVDTGVRVSELCNLTVGDVDLKANRAYVIGKGDKPRYVYFGKICGQALWRYFVERFPNAKAKNDEPFFVTIDGIHTLDRHAVRLAIRRLGEKVGDPNLHPHRFRHTFAVQFLRNGGNIFALQQLLGHSSLDMVRHYAQLAEIDLEDAATHSSPADNWRL